ncbi:MAG: hypothetical protein D6820_09530 [Lentisphaerae bacterium]|nr:MAG: hypothetical protein D6820_09530 [Lentisphaerota bacterium]
MKWQLQRCVQSYISGQAELGFLLAEAELLGENPFLEQSNLPPPEEIKNDPLLRTQYELALAIRLGDKPEMLSRYLKDGSAQTAVGWLLHARVALMNKDWHRFRVALNALMLAPAGKEGVAVWRFAPDLMVGNIDVEPNLFSIWTVMRSFFVHHTAKQANSRLSPAAHGGEKRDNR